MASLSRRLFLAGLGAFAVACTREPGPAVQVAPTVAPAAPPPAAPTEVPETAAPPPPQPTATVELQGEERNGIAPGASASSSLAEPTPRAAPTPLAYDAARLKDKLASAQTSYAGSIPARAWNVELAVKKLNGAKIAPGEVFSFNKVLGPQTLSAGFRVGYGITLDGDRPETVPSVAGGICQVATTLFQAAYWTGLPFVERHYHLYWIEKYGQPPLGKTGLDATVDDPGVDLKLKNTTDDWLRIEARTADQNVYFEIFGVKPDWEVEVGEPKVRDVVPTSQALVRQPDPSLPPGQELAVEHAEDGFTVTLSRLVKQGGRVIDEYTFTNTYRPARNVVLVGAVAAPPTPVPRAVPPTEAPAPAASPTVAPAAQPSPTPAPPPPTAKPAAQKPPTPTAAPPPKPTAPTPTPKK